MTSDKLKEFYQHLFNLINSGNKKNLEQTELILQYLCNMQAGLNQKIDAMQNDINIIKKELDIHTQSTNSEIADVSGKLHRTVERVENLHQKFDQEIKSIHNDIDMTNELFKLITVNDLINSIEDELQTDDQKKSSNNVKSNIMVDISNVTAVKDSADCELKAKAESGDDKAAFNLAYQYENGFTGEQDYKKALDWYIKASSQGNASASYKIGEFYSKGLGVVKNDETAETWYNKAVQQGYPGWRIKKFKNRDTVMDYKRYFRLDGELKNLRTKILNNDKTTVYLPQTSLNDYDEIREMEYYYNDGDLYYFLNLDSYEKLSIRGDLLPDAFKFVRESMICKVMIYENEIVGVILPDYVELIVVQTLPRQNNDIPKHAVLETGAKVMVPNSVVEGDIVKIDTRTGEYVSKV